VGKGGIRVDKIKKVSIIALTCILLSMAISTIVSAENELEGFGSDTSDEVAFGLGIAICAFALIWLIVFILIAIWVYKDAEKRGSSGILWLLIVIVLGLIGIIIWLVVRPPIGGKPGQQQQQQGQGRVCPSCGRPIPMDAQVCPYCANKFGP